MGKIKWCFGKKEGIRLVEKNILIGKSYLKMAEEFIGTMRREKDKNIRAAVSSGYYSIYYSLYSIMQKIGIKCEIHSCSIEFMKVFLNEFYSSEDIELVERSFAVRNIMQYYVDRTVNKKEIDLIFNNSYEFFVLSRDIFSRINEDKIDEIRNKLQEKMK